MLEANFSSVSTWASATLVSQDLSLHNVALLITVIHNIEFSAWQNEWEERNEVKCNRLAARTDSLPVYMHICKILR